MKIRLPFLLPLVAVFILMACNKKTEETEIDETGETEAPQLVYAIPRDFTLNALTIEGEADMIDLSYDGEKWEGSNENEFDSQSIDAFVDDLYQLRGLPTEELTEEEGVTITLANAKEKHALFIWESEGDRYLSVDEQSYVVDEWPASLSPFDPIFLHAPLQVELEDVEEIEFEDATTFYTLNQETRMNEVERKPFISGWYIHGAFETPFSAEYNWLQRFVSQLTTLRGYPTEQDIEETQQTIRLSNELQMWIGQEVDERYTLVALSTHETPYLVPTQLLDVFEMDLLSRVDNFIALLPVDNVQEVSILTEDVKLAIRITHSSEEGSTFYVNDEEIEEATFRRTYQYLARLAYSEALDEEEKSNVSTQDSDVLIHYTYLVDGEVKEKTIRFVAIADSSDYIVINDGIIEFKMTDDRLKDMLEAFHSL